MVYNRSFSKRMGTINLPMADVIEDNPETVLRSIEGTPAISPGNIDLGRNFKFCRTKLKEGCYSLNFKPKKSPIWGPYYRGTLRVEKVGGNYRISGDFYVRSLFILANQEEFTLSRIAKLPSNFASEADPVETEGFGGRIPIYSRKSYYSYLKGTGARLSTFTGKFSKCWFSLDFDEFRYQHPATGFSGSFPSSPTRSLRFSLFHTNVSDNYSGKIYLGGTELGKVSIRWLSSYFRRATLEIHTLDGAVTPPQVTNGPKTEDFRSVFKTAGWDLNVIDGGKINLPASLSGVQNPNQCWASANSARLMESVPGYNPGQLDKVWKARLLAIPAKMGCSRGRMFDNGSGDINNVPREGAVTHSHDGYPTNPNFGAAKDKQQKDVPRAFLRSAAHEVGHTFNQIHQTFEGGSDNSIMTVTPIVANVLAASSQSFPDDINLGFNQTVRRHLVHLPDPGVRPGAIEFFGSSINLPEADEVVWPSELTLELETQSTNLRLGEPLSLTWKLKNVSDQPLPVPGHLDVESLSARVNVTDPRGDVTFMRPANLETCPFNEVKPLAPKSSVAGSTVVFWGKDGLAFESPGRHCVEVIVIWDVNGVQVGAATKTEVWIAYPLTEKDNQIASLLLCSEVGEAVAFGQARPGSDGEQRIKNAVKLQEAHPACAQMKKLILSK